MNEKVGVHQLLLDSSVVVISIHFEKVNNNKKNK